MLNYIATKLSVSQLQHWHCSVMGLSSAQTLPKTSLLSCPLTYPGPLTLDHLTAHPKDINYSVFFSSLDPVRFILRPSHHLICRCVYLLTCVRVFVTPTTIVLQPPLPKEFSR